MALMIDERAEWLNWRRGGIGASDVAGILNLSPWASPFSVWASKVDDTDDTHDTDAMEFGRRAEIMVAPWFADRTGLTVVGEQTRCAHRDDPWKMCTVDGFVLDSPNSQMADALGVLEIKTTSASADEWANEIPVNYRCQATWAMHVTDQPHCWFAVLHLAFGRPRFEVYQFDRDPDEETFVVDACTRFWHDHVLTGEPPAVDGHQATTDAIKAHWPTADGSLQADALTRRMVDRVRAHKATAKLIEANIAEAENELRAALGDREALVDAAGDVLASWKPQQATRLDTKALKAAHPALADEFTSTTTSRVLRIKTPKES